MAGYSDKPLVIKLCYAPGDSVFVHGKAAEFQKYLKLHGIVPVETLPATWVHGFFMSLAEVIAFVDSEIIEQAEKGAWLSWPKKASGIQTDLTEQAFRDQLLPLGWVDTKVVAIDETWSGLLFYRRKL